MTYDNNKIKKIKQTEPQPISKKYIFRKTRGRVSN